MSATLECGGPGRFGLDRLCTKSLDRALLCATFVFSVSLWLMTSKQKHTTETQRTQRLHRGNSRRKTFSAKPSRSRSATCNFCVLCVSVVDEFRAKHTTEVVQRKVRL